MNQVSIISSFLCFLNFLAFLQFSPSSTILLLNSSSIFVHITGKNLLLVLAMEWNEYMFLSLEVLDLFVSVNHKALDFKYLDVCGQMKLDDYEFTTFQH